MYELCVPKEIREEKGIESVAKRNPLNAIKGHRVLFPIAIGLGVVAYSLVKNFEPEVFMNITLTRYAVFWFLIAIFLMLTRDIGYIIRIRFLSSGQLSWRQAIRVVFLWEFASAVTPSAIGGTGIAIIFLNQENISIGRSSAIVMATSFLDELYFIITFPLMLLFLKGGKLFAFTGEGGQGLNFSNAFFITAVIGYSVKLIYTMFISYGLFINPRGLKWLLLWIFKLPVLRRWRQGANEAGSEIISSSIELRKKPFSFWLKSFVATIFSWTSRYWVVNALFLAFFVVPDHFLLYARQLVVWIMMLISPTPGGSGFSEYVFNQYFLEFIPVDYFDASLGNIEDMRMSFIIALAFLWRLISYYPYLVIGAVIFPRWLRMKFTK